MRRTVWASVKAWVSSARCLRTQRHGVGPSGRATTPALTRPVARSLTPAAATLPPMPRPARRPVQRGPPTYLRSDNGPSFTTRAVRSWLQRLGVTTLFIAPGSPWENESGESFNGTLRDEGLNPEIFTTRTEAPILIERWRRESNPVRPHSALDYRPPAPEALEIRPPHPRPLGRPEGRSTNFSTGTTIGGRSVRLEFFESAKRQVTHR